MNQHTSPATAALAGVLGQSETLANKYAALLGLNPVQDTPTVLGTCDQINEGEGAGEAGAEVYNTEAAARAECTRRIETTNHLTEQD